MGLPEETIADIRRRLIEAATKLFIEEGYRASIERIAARAGVARQTVYNHFSSKDDLFSEVANLVAGSILVTLDGEGLDVRERLQRFGVAFRLRVLSDEGLAMYRTIAAEVPRFPELGRAFFAKGPEQTITRLAAFLAQEMDAGTLRRDDPRFAAELLTSMLTGFDRTRRLFGAAADPDHHTEDREQALVARIIDSFLRIHALPHSPPSEGLSHDRTVGIPSDSSVAPADGLRAE
ncbi:MAG: TetR/AcrR family transcriptional regulator [Magnetococcales bacterium]|nr:TetR/AcrR family transcriptional regulator [Magnetococcales bacterium]